MTKPTKGSIEIDDCSTGDWGEPLLSLKAKISSYEDSMLKGQYEDAKALSMAIGAEAFMLAYATNGYINGR